MGIAETIRKRREELDITLLDIAKKVGMSEATIQRYESGKIKHIRQDKIVPLAAALKLTPAELLGWEVETPSPATSKESDGKRVLKLRRMPIVAHENSGESGNSGDTGTRLTNPDDIIAFLEKLAALHSKGILTDEEYIGKKRELLNRL